MAELVDARDSKSRFERSVGSIPTLGTSLSEHKTLPTTVRRVLFCLNCHN